MAKFAVGTKQEMTQLFDENGRAHPATVVRIAPMQVTQVKTLETDGYSGVQVGVGSQKESRVHKAQRSKGTFRHMKEFRVNDTSSFKVGEVFALAFEPGDIVVVSGVSKGKGFQGVVKRHGFHGGPRTHGQKHSEREPGSIGATGPQRVFKGTRMAGRMGGERVSVKNLKVLAVDAENGLLFIRGAIPGRRGTFIEIRGAESENLKANEATS